MTWTSERIEQLKALWLEGWSGGQIMQKLRLSSRSQVIGKVYRLGLKRTAGYEVRIPRRPKSADEPRRGWVGREPRMAPTPRFRKRPLPRFVATPATVEPLMCSVLDLEYGVCRWAVGEPDEYGRHLFCGAPALDRRPYCACHTKLAYAPEKPRRKARPVR